MVEKEQIKLLLEKESPLFPCQINHHKELKTLLRTTLASASMEGEQKDCVHLMFEK